MFSYEWCMYIRRECARVGWQGARLLQSRYQQVGGYMHRLPDAAEPYDDGRGTRLREISSNVHLAESQLHAPAARVRRPVESCPCSGDRRRPPAGADGVRRAVLPVAPRASVPAVPARWKPSSMVVDHADLPGRLWDLSCKRSTVVRRRAVPGRQHGLCWTVTGRRSQSAGGRLTVDRVARLPSQFRLGADGRRRASDVSPGPRAPVGVDAVTDVAPRVRLSTTSQHQCQEWSRVSLVVHTSSFQRLVICFRAQATRAGRSSWFSGSVYVSRSSNK